MIVIKHIDSTDPVSSRDGVTVTRTQKEAIGRIKKIRDKVCAPSDFNVKMPAKPKEVKRRFVDAAKAQSDHTTYKDGGDLGIVVTGSLPPAVEKAAFALKENAISAEVSSEEGVHLLLRAS